MADPVEPDLRDLGDTDHLPFEEVVAAPVAAEKPAAKPAEVPVETPPVDERPRNPDGTFAPVARAHPLWLVEAATELGFGEDEIAETPSDLLNRHVIRAHRQQHIFTQEISRARALADVKPVATPAPPEDDLGINPEVLDVMDPTVVAFLKRQAKENRDLKAALGKISETQEQTARSAIEQQIDAGFDALGETFAAIVGTGPLADLTDVEHREARMAIYQRASAKDMQGSPKARIAKAAKLIYGKVIGAKPAAAAPAPNAYDAPAAKPPIPADEWNKAGLARPTQRQDKSDELPLGEDRAVRNLRKKLDALKGEERDVLNGIPD